MTLITELCQLCEQFPCQCEKKTRADDWLIQHCSTPGCETAIRVRADQSLTHPICTWCDRNVSHATKPRTWPAGMPDPELPWPWLSDTERSRQLALPYWQARFRQHIEVYGKFLNAPHPTITQQKGVLAWITLIGLSNSLVP